MKKYYLIYEIANQRSLTLEFESKEECYSTLQSLDLENNNYAVKFQIIEGKRLTNIGRMSRECPHWEFFIDNTTY